MAKSKTFFKAVDLKINFPEAEKKLLDSWYKDGLVNRYLGRNRTSGKYFSFLDGPITANNPMGVHHAWGRTYKDLWQRFKNMQGFKQRFQNGFDAQGLWVEVEVEKELGFKNKKEIEDFGIAKFVQLCKDRVKKYSGIQTEQSKRLGYFMDWDNSYYTLSDDNNYMIWGFLKKVNENGWLYKGSDVVPWCPRCETAISEHEILTENYKEATHESIFLGFPVVGKSNEFLLAWTTTPWTIPANIALAVDPDMEYVLVEANRKNYWLSRVSVGRVFAGRKVKQLKIVRGEKLVGLKYRGPFDDLPVMREVIVKRIDKFHTVVATDSFIMPISTEEGTGIVHTSTGTGAEDHKFGKKIGLPVVPAIDDEANYLPGFGFLSGKNAKKHPELIIDYLNKLDEGKFILRTVLYAHRYPSCWRCKTELVWKVTDEWYISMDTPSKTVNKQQTTSNLTEEKWKDGEEEPAPPDTRTLRQRMIEVAQKIDWIPGFGKDRELDWLTNMHDWLISKKNRYWGLALPIWECKKCGNFDVIGSKEELRQRTLAGWKEFNGKTPHKPQIDAIKIKCSRCGEIASRIEPVGNPWLDAGIVAFSTISSSNKACNFDVTKTKLLYLTDKEEWQKWFPADFITESFPGQFKNWFYALIAMSTVLEDTNPFRTVLGFATVLGEDGRPMHKSWGNAIEFNEAADRIGVDVMRWMFVRQNPSENLLFGYRAADETRRRFHLKLWNVYNFFVTYANLDEFQPSRHRVAASSILDRWILARLNQTISMVTESMEKYDAYVASGKIEEFVDDLSLWYVRRSRDRVGPVAQSNKDSDSFYRTTYYVLVMLSKLLAPFMPFLSEMMYLNLTGGKDSVHLSDWPEAEPLSAKDEHLVREMKDVREVVEKVHSQRKEKRIVVRQPLLYFATSYPEPVSGLTDLVRDEVNVKKIEWGKLKGKELTVKLDTKITPELKEEAEVRDLVRKIQEARKGLGLNLTQKVDVKIPKIPPSNELVQWMQKKAQINKLTVGKFKVIKSS